LWIPRVSSSSSTFYFALFPRVFAFELHFGQIFAARPLFPHLRTTPLAGARLTSHLRALLLLFGTYLPPPTSLSAAANIPASNRSTRVPQEVLTDDVIEEIKTRCCFVGDALGSSIDMRGTTPSVDESSELDIPPSDSTQSESEFSRAGLDSNISSERASSEFSVVSGLPVPNADNQSLRSENHLQALATMYTRHSTATQLQMRVVPPISQQAGTGRGTLIIPGWIRERGAEVLFEGGDVDESSVAEVILDALLKVPDVCSIINNFLTASLHVGTCGSSENTRIIYFGGWGDINVAWVHSSLAY